jgi:formylglycine-generating enzyme required for sulfatase activity
LGQIESEHYNFILLLCFLGEFLIIAVAALVFDYKKHHKNWEQQASVFFPNYVFPASPARFWFRLFPFLDRKKAYWETLENNGKHTKDKLEVTFANYVQPSTYLFEEEAKLYPQLGKKAALLQGKLKKKPNLSILFHDGFLQERSKQPVLILADTGIGKTTFLQKLFLAYAQTYPENHLAFVYASQNSIEQIKNIPDKENTILLLDAIDEDAIARANWTTYTNQITPLFLDFKKVIITCRNQFFKENSEEWQHLKNGIDIYRLELLAFTTAEAEEYIKKAIAKEYREKAEKIFKGNPDFFRRPLLLSYLEILAQEPRYARKYQFLYQIYAEILLYWGRNEAKTTQKDIQDERDYPKRLTNYSKDLAKAIDEKQKTNYLLALAKTHGIKEIDAQSRSLLTRNRQTNVFEFTHDSFLEYFWACLFFEGIFREEKLEDGSPHPLLDPAADQKYLLQFYNEMCWHKIAGVTIAKEVNTDDMITDLKDDTALKKLSVSKNVLGLDLFDNRQIRAYCIKHRHFLTASVTRTAVQYQVLELLKANGVGHYFIIDFFEAIKKDQPPTENNIFLTAFIAQLYQVLVGELRLSREKYKDFWDLKQEKKLVFGQEITAMPRGIGYLNNLTELRLCNPYLETKALPSEMWSLHNLTILDLKVKQLKTLPPVRNLPRLMHLDLSNNDLAALSSEIVQLQDLTHLNLSWNKLKTLPNEIGQLKNLTNLVLWGNDFSKAEKARIHRLVPQGYKVQLLNPDPLQELMIEIEGGTFLMGSDKRAEEQPIHSVTVPTFFMSKYAVTVAQFRMFVDSTNYLTEAERDGGSYVWDGSKSIKKEGLTWRNNTAEGIAEDNHPVIYVSWNDAVAYTQWLSEATGKNYRLPTEAEWEYAARGGSFSEGFEYPGSNNLDEVGWYWENSGDEPLSEDWSWDKVVQNNCRTHPVGQKQPNELGLYDMSGNVWEWCEDVWHDNYSGAPQNGTAWLIGGDNSRRVLRGGSWFNVDYYSRVALRYRNVPSNRNLNVGFRLARGI